MFGIDDSLPAFRLLRAGGTRCAARWTTNAEGRLGFPGRPSEERRDDSGDFRLGMGLRVELRDGGAIQEALAGFEGRGSAERTDGTRHVRHRAPLPGRFARHPTAIVGSWLMGACGEHDGVEKACRLSFFLGCSDGRARARSIHLMNRMQKAVKNNSSTSIRLVAAMRCDRPGLLKAHNSAVPRRVPTRTHPPGSKGRVTKRRRAPTPRGDRRRLSCRCDGVSSCSPPSRLRSRARPASSDRRCRRRRARGRPGTRRRRRVSSAREARRYPRRRTRGA